MIFANYCHEGGVMNDENKVIRILAVVAYFRLTESCRATAALQLEQ